MTLRRYQAESVEKTLAALARSGSAVLQMPTGAGKTKTATEIIANHDGIVWFVCHRREIERQAAKAFREAGIEFGIVSPRSKPDYSKRVQIVSVGTLDKRFADLPAPSLVIWDECHHVAADSWAKIREALSNAWHLGLTATPERFDGKGLREWFAELIPGPSIPDLIPEFLSTYSYFAPSSPDLTAARMQAGDYAKGDAAKIMNTPVLIGDAFREYREKADGKRALAFCVTKEASRALVERFQAEGVPAVHVDANTKDDEREAAVEDLVAGRIKLISNVEVFTEGVDIPEIDAVILLRPTKSPTLFFQMVGRVLRKAKGKAGAVILDHAGLVEDHGRLNDPWTWSIDGGAAKARRKASAGFRKCPKCKFCPQEREPVCSACGYEYPTGREVGEFDGVLREIRGEVPEGCETQAEFARRWGCSSTACTHWFRVGMPCVGGYVLSTAADEWLVRNSRQFRDVNKYMTAAEFAKAVGAKFNVVSYFLEKNKVEKTERGYIVFNSTVAIWEDLVKAQKFTAEITVRSLSQKYGIAESIVGKVLKDAGKKPRYGVSDEHEEIIAQWAKERTPAAGEVRINDFAEILGVTNNAVHTKMILKGMPRRRGPKINFIPIREALEWVRDNRPDIVIPPEAWPAADNDNGAITKAA